MLARFKDFDFYRNIPRDLTESTTHGSVLSFCASIFMLVLFVAELWAFVSKQTITNVVIDPNTDALLRINFNITVMDIPCEYAMIDVIDVLGTRKDNITKNVNKWQVDAQGIKRNYEGRNMEQRDLMHDVHHDLDQLTANGVHAIPIEEENMENWLQSHHYTFVNYYAPWCVWCQRLEPVWEAFAETVSKADFPVSIVKVDCIANSKLCIEQKVIAFPSLRLFKKNIAQPPDYRSDRTVNAMMEYLRNTLSVEEQVSKMNSLEKLQHTERKELERDDHPGCLLSGFLLVNRVPGNFHIEARSKHHNLNSETSNVSHIVNHLSFGPVLSRGAVAKLEQMPKELFDLRNTEAMDGNGYVSEQLHQAFHHYIKVVSTTLQPTLKYTGVDSILAYQMVQSSQIMQYNEEDVPEARFSYDLSPMAVLVKKKGKHWYEFVTSMCALIGGTFTVLGLLSNTLNAIFKNKKN